MNILFGILLIILFAMAFKLVDCTSFRDWERFIISNNGRVKPTIFSVSYILFSALSTYVLILGILFITGVIKIF